MKFPSCFFFIAVVNIAVISGLLSVGYNDTHVWVYNVTHCILYSYDNTLPGSLVLVPVEKKGFPDRLVRSDKAEIRGLTYFLTRQVSNSNGLIGNEETTGSSPPPFIIRLGSD